MAVVSGWAGIECLVVLLFVTIGQSAVPFTPSGSGVLGEKCTYDGMCTSPSSYCKRGACDCKSGFRNVNNNCIIAPELGEHCTRDEECAYTREASRCADNVCKRCSEGSEKEFSSCTELVGGCAFHEYDGQCFHYRRIGEHCDTNEECWIYPNSNSTRQCVLAMCVCVQSLDTMSGPLPDGQVDQCVPRPSAASCASISMFLALTSLLVLIVLNEK